MKYLSRAFEVEAEQWTDLNRPPFGIHDIWTSGSNVIYGYLPTPSGDKLAWLECFIVKYPSGDVLAMSPEEFNLRFTAKA